MASDTDTKAFATSFAQLATNQLSQKVPGIMQKMLGFQVIKKAEDDSRAVGFFGFDFGGSLVYTPAFFLRGEIRGLISLYIKDKDLFIPLDEKWVEFIEAKKHEPLGQAATGTPQDMGITAPDFSQSSPFTYNAKMAALAAKMPAWAHGGLAMFNSNLRSPRYEKIAGLMEGLRVSTPEVGFKFLNMLKTQPKLAEFVLQNYDMEVLKDAVLDTSSLKVASERIFDVVTKELQIITTKVAGMTDAEKEELIKVGYVVRDSRKDTSTLIKSDVKTFDNPTQPGFYKVLFRADGFDDAYVFHTFTVGAGRTKSGMIVYRPGEKYIHKALSRDILTNGEPSLSKTDWTSKLEKVGKSPSDITRGEVVVFVDKHGNATVPFRVDTVTSDDGNTYVKGVEQTWSDFVSEPIDKLPTDYDTARRDSYSRPLDPEANDNMYRCSPISTGSGFGNSYETTKQHKGVAEVIISSKDLDGFVNVGPKLLVPKSSSRVIVLGKDDMYSPSSVDSWKDREKERLARDNLGTANDVENGLRKSASLDRVKVVIGDSGISISSDKLFLSGLSKVAALDNLTSKFRLHADDAKEIIKTATARGADSFFVKHAISMADISQPYFDSSTKTMANSPQVRNIRDPYFMPGREKTPDPNFGQGGGQYDITGMENAAASGQKDIFDSAALGALININDPSEEINKYISDLILSVDRIGRILFMMYWHYDTFEERYEKQDLVSLEDNLINVFENLGEVTLDLTQRAVVDSPTISGFQLG